MPANLETECLLTINWNIINSKCYCYVYILVSSLWLAYCSLRAKVIYYCSLWQVVGEGNGTPLQYSCLENPMDGGAWWAAVHGIARSPTLLSNFTFTFHFHPLEKEMATHSSVLIWRIPEMGEPGGLPTLGSHRVGHDWSDLAAAAAAADMHMTPPLWQKVKRNKEPLDEG